jgi:CxxC-x17-CxxC domain-containing protein
MTYFNRGGGDSRSQYYSSREGSFGSRGGNDRGSDRPAMFDAVCAKCGANCQVPFKPNGRKEVFCSKCFDMMGGGDRDSRGSRDSGGFGGRDSRSFNERGPRSFADKPMFSAICDECGDNCQVPFEPRNGKPVLCSDCFAKKDGGRNESRSFSPSARPAAGNMDLSELNAKLDKIIKLLTPTEPKNITEKILETIEINSGKEVAPAKKKAKVAKKKVVKE